MPFSHLDFFSDFFNFYVSLCPNVSFSAHIRVLFWVNNTAFPVALPPHGSSLRISDLKPPRFSPCFVSLFVLCFHSSLCLWSLISQNYS